MMAVGESLNLVEKVEYTFESGINVIHSLRILLLGLNSTKDGSIKEYKTLKNKAPFLS
jgi:hypothetical protein